jgi:hypothetical protein
MAISFQEVSKCLLSSSFHLRAGEYKGLESYKPCCICCPPQRLFLNFPTEILMTMLQYSTVFTGKFFLLCNPNVLGAI